MNTTAYHLTLEGNLASIMEKGLIPVIGERSADWGELTPAVYLFPSLDDLENALGNWLGEYFEEDEVLHILEVNIEGLELVSDAEYELASFETITPERITFLREE